MIPEYFRDNEITLVRNVISEEDCTEIISFLNKQNEWKRSKVYENNGQRIVEADTRTCTDFEISSRAKAYGGDMKRLDEQLHQIFSTALNYYYEKHPQLPIKRDEGYTALRYDKGQKFTDHYDVIGNGSQRVLSGILYLNEGYTGGELTFPTMNLQFKPKPGDVIMFPSNFIYVHRSEPIVDGIKYAVVTWFH